MFSECQQTIIWKSVTDVISVDLAAKYSHLILTVELIKYGGKNLPYMESTFKLSQYRYRKRL